MTEISEATEATALLVAGLARLLPQLSPNATAPDLSRLRQILAAGATRIFIATENSVLVGCLVLAVFPTLTGTRAWVEDVVVDAAQRGKGIGEALSRAALAAAQQAGATSIDLTSHRSREAANRLYQRLGFALRQTNVYRWQPPK